MNNRLNYQSLLERYHWLKDENKSAVISPDVDGFLCGLIMSYYLNWEIIGFYDGSKMLIGKSKDWRECIFLDMEIYQKDICSIGNHLLLYNKNQKPSTWEENFSQCINPNNLREFDKIHDFKRKYPFGTIHFLICLLENIVGNVKISEKAIGIILFADGVFKSIMNYPENCIDWLNWLNAKELKIFEYFKEAKLTDIIHSLEKIFKNLNLPNGKLRLGKITNNVSDVQNKVYRFLNQLSELTEWKVDKSKWEILNLDNLHEPIIIKRSRITKINGKKYKNELNNPKVISFSFPSYDRLEYSVITKKRL